MFESVDWSQAEGHIRDRGRITTMQADEALVDSDPVVISPDYNSKPGQSVRVIGYSDGARALSTVIVIIDEDGHEYGINGWHSNAKDRRIYEEGWTP